jgi:aldose 1-epimerase
MQTIHLTDSASGAEAAILAGFGFNCYRFRVRFDDQPLDVLWSEPGFDSGQKRASGSGIPLLFPYAGRLRGKTLNWNGGAWPLEGDDNRGNAIHGYVLNRPWRVLEQSDRRAVGQFQASRDAPALLPCWPADFRITATYELAGTSLSSSFLIENPDQRPLPFGFGTHPYFCVPLGGSRGDDCLVELPVGRRWELVEMLATGRRLPVDPPEAYQAGLPFAEMKFDDAFTDLVFDGGWCRPRIVDPGSGRRLVVEFDQAFRECVVYNPPHRQAVCIEPLTWCPNAFELEQQGLDAGLRILPPGQSLQCQVTMRVE